MRCCRPCVARAIASPRPGSRAVSRSSGDAWLRSLGRMRHWPGDRPRRRDGRHQCGCRAGLAAMETAWPVAAAAGAAAAGSPWRHRHLATGRPAAVSQPARCADAQATLAGHVARLSRGGRGASGRRDRAGSKQPAHCLVQRRSDAAARPGLSGGRGCAAGRSPAIPADRPLAGRRAARRAVVRPAIAGGPADPPQPAPDPLFRHALAAGRTRRHQTHAAGADAPRLRGQRVARAAHAIDGGARLPGHARSRRPTRMGADPARDARANTGRPARARPRPSG